MRDVIDKNLKWILSIIGFVSGIAMFIVAMRRDFYLYATVIGAILLVGALYLGDVIISLSRAKVQATAGGHPIQDELQLLVVHGVLHLLGYDHAEEDEKSNRWAIQAKILDSRGCKARA